jgi:hypothetical protein
LATGQIASWLQSTRQLLLTTAIATGLVFGELFTVQFEAAAMQ